MPRLPWLTLAAAMQHEDAEMLVQDFKRHKISKSDLAQCHVCLLPAPHAMRVQLLRCTSKTCARAALRETCPWRARLLRCSLLKVVTIEEANALATAVRDAPRPPVLSAEMKRVALDWAVQDLKAKRVWMGLQQRFNLDEQRAPSLAAVQQLVHYHVAGRLGGSDLLAVVRGKVRGRLFSGEEEETAEFSLCLHQDDEGKPVVGNGSDKAPFVIGVSTKKLLRQADRDPATFILHLDATYKLTQAGYPVIVVGLSDRARHFHPLAIFIVSQQKQPQYTEMLQLLLRAYAKVTGKAMRVQYVMGDADIAQWNAVHDAFGADVYSLMCYFHVAKKVFEKTRSLTPRVAASVMEDLHTLHFTLSEKEYFEKLGEVQRRWALVPQLVEFSTYFANVWLNRRVWRWQCFHTPSGFATTNNPRETYNAALKRDVTLRRKLKIGAMLDQLFTLCESESVRPRPFADAPTPDARLIRRAAALQREGMLLERRVDRSSIAFLLEGSAVDADNIVRVASLPTPRVYDEFLSRTVENLPVSARLGSLTASMERVGMPDEGWPVDVWRQVCPCRMCSKVGTCVHVLCALAARGCGDLNGRATLVYRGSSKRRRQVGAQPAGRPSNSGAALAFE